MWQILLGGFLETVLIILVGLRLIGISIKKKWIAIGVVSFYGSSILIIVRNTMPAGTYLIITILAIGILLSFVIESGVISNIVAILFGCLALIISEIISFTILRKISFIDDFILGESPLLKAIPHLSVMVLIFILLLKIKFYIPFPVKKKPQKNYTAFSILFLLFGFLFLFYIYAVELNSLIFFSVPSAVFLLAITISIFYIVRYQLLNNTEILSLSLNDQYEEDISKQIRILKSQRHDFIHHLLATKQMLNRGHYEESLSYINSILNESAAISDVLPISSDAISGLLLSYKEKANSLGIEIFYQINDNLSLLPCKTFEINKILGNLIKNSIEAVKDFEAEKKCIHMKIYRDKYYRIEISNFIKEEDTIRSASSFFIPGFSTKAGNSGVGLVIIEELLNEYQGSIHFDITGDLITFKVSLPYGGI